jgi:hypothetical protein
LYLNGVLDISAAAAKGTIAASSADFIIGSTYNVGFSVFNGNIASVNLYNKALAATEVLQNYNATKSRFGL